MVVSDTKSAFSRAELLPELGFAEELLWPPLSQLGVPTIMENQMEKKMENEMETGII